MDNNIISKVAALGGTISTTDISHLSEYKRLLRAKERGDLIKLRHGIYAVPDTLLNTMIDVERIVPNGGCVKTPLLLKKSQSPDFHKPGLCYV